MKPPINVRKSINNKIINRSMSICTGYSSESVSIFSNNWRLVLNTNKSFLHAGTEFGMNGRRTDILLKFPFIIIRNSIVINNYYPTIDEWMALLMIKSEFPNINKIHFYVSMSNIKAHGYINLNDAIDKIEEIGILDTFTIPTIITNSSLFEMGIKRASRKKPIKCIYNKAESITFDISNEYHKKEVTIIPNSKCIIPGIVNDDKYVYEMKFRHYEKSKKGSKQNERN